MAARSASSRKQTRIGILLFAGFAFLAICPTVVFYAWSVAASESFHDGPPRIAIHPSGRVHHIGDYDEDANRSGPWAFWDERGVLIEDLHSEERSGYYVDGGWVRELTEFEREDLEERAAEFMREFQ